MYAMHRASRINAGNGKVRLCGSFTEDVAVAIGEVVLLEGTMVGRALGEDRIGTLAVKDAPPEY